MKNQNPHFNDETIVAALPDHLTCDLSGDAAILKISDGIYYGLNETAAFLWERMQKPIRFDRLREEMLAAFDVPSDEASRDMSALLEQMLNAKLIETRDAMAP